MDDHEDWFLVNGEEHPGWTILEFTRKWVTCDQRDSNIEVFECTVTKCNKVLHGSVSAVSALNIL